MPKENPLAAARAAKQAKIAALSENEKNTLAEKEKHLRKVRKELKAAKEVVKSLKQTAELAKSEVDAILG